MAQPPITEFKLEITFLNFHADISGANDLIAYPIDVRWDYVNANTYFYIFYEIYWIHIQRKSSKLILLFHCDLWPKLLWSNDGAMCFVLHHSWWTGLIKHNPEGDAVHRHHPGTKLYGYVHRHWPTLDDVVKLIGNYLNVYRYSIFCFCYPSVSIFCLSFLSLNIVAVCHHMIPFLITG